MERVTYWKERVQEAEEQLADAETTLCYVEAQLALAREQAGKDPLSVKTICSGSVLRMKKNAPSQFAGRTCTLIAIASGLNSFRYKLLWNPNTLLKESDVDTASTRTTTGNWHDIDEVRSFFRQNQDQYTRIN